MDMSDMSEGRRRCIAALLRATRADSRPDAPPRAIGPDLAILVLSYAHSTIGSIPQPDLLKGKVAIGINHYLAIAKDGSVTAKGMNDDGQCKVPDLAGQPLSVSCGSMLRSMSIAVVQDHSGINKMKAWGAEGNHVTGLSFFNTGEEVVQVATALSASAILYRNGKASFALRDSMGCTTHEEEGVAYVAAFGGGIGPRPVVAAVFEDGRFGMLPRNCPLMAPGTMPRWDRPVVQVVLGAYWCAVLLDDGSVRAWGQNASAELEVRSRRDSKRIFGSGKVLKMAEGDTHTVALRDDGAVITWGHNMSAGSCLKCNIPNFGGLRAVDIDAGAYNSIALLENGNVSVWGEEIKERKDWWSGLRVDDVPPLLRVPERSPRPPSAKRARRTECTIS